MCCALKAAIAGDAAGGSGGPPVFCALSIAAGEGPTGGRGGGATGAGFPPETERPRMGEGPGGGGGGPGGARFRGEGAGGAMKVVSTIAGALTTLAN